MQIDDCQIVCISLDRRPDRWAAVKASADAAGLPLTRFRAVDAREFEAPAWEHPDVSVLTAHNLLRRTRRSHYEIDRAGAIGCSLSHFGVWRGLLNSGASAVIVFEDDLEIPVDLRRRLERLCAMLPADWDVIQLHATRFDSGLDCRPDARLGGDGRWHTCQSLMGAHAYMVSRRGAEKLLARAYPIELHVDAYMAFLARLGWIRMLWHPLVNLEQGDLGSDIAHGGAGILNVPTNMEREGVWALETQELLGIIAIAAVAGGLVAVAVAGRRRS
jgi:GR25 family glycosyltransferase involved in LPS biosynthesis